MNKFTISYKLALAVCVSTLLVVTPFVANADNSKNIIKPKKVEVVLGEKTKEVASPTVTPIIVVSKIPTPTVTQIPTPTPTSIASKSNNSSSNTTPTITPSTTPTPTPTITPTPILPTASPTPTPTPTLTQIQLTISIDYGGQKPNDSYNVTVEDGRSAWEAVQKAVGVANLQFTDYGGNLGIFITGFNGINAASNQFYEFKVNGSSSQVGISSYVCKNGDSLSFVLTTF